MALLPVFTATAQTGSVPFDLMLKGLLSHTVPPLSADSLAAMHGVVLLDAREKPEYEASHLQQARWVGYNNFNPSRLKGIPTDTTIVVYCSVGYRSEKIGEQLQQLGYKQVYNLYGGIFSWVNNNQPVVNTTGQPTDTVHAYSKSWGVWLQKGQKVYK